ncbi:ABC transporter ATP-binding protein [Microbacterium aquimaris]|uniref:ABC transporter ATP-binding protein n=1 Tax=Microbacterium aquimaris TaxID=459816 RepID=UPI002AD2B2F0|nr:ABC transporter ATP-binding protein [Microbacterium aquimaris]MDZ8275150.1 ABC transporter ATP-binding protein [Microbacterium aquimaris]
MSREPLLSVSGLNVSYGHVHILQDVAFTMGAEPLGMVGRNGMGKSTLAKALAGMLPIDSGSMRFGDRELVGRTPNQVNRAGVGYVPQGRRIFPSLTVHEHLTMVGGRRSRRWSVADVYDLFPRLAERRRNGGAELSGGEQQMLAIARALLTDPHLLVMDEPSEGLAPAIVDHLADTLRMLVREGQAVLLIEQNLRFTLELCPRVLVMVNGRIAADLEADVLAHDPDAQARYLGVSESHA